MGQAAMTMWRAATEVEEVGAGIGAAIPDDWRGRAAEEYRRRAERLVQHLVVLADAARTAARLADAHEREVAATRAALDGGMVAV